jgi:2-polyprenyl-3-methyl-5-hydroxy-6-metoxy-1,4-benzoquinol methylase
VNKPEYYGHPRREMLPFIPPRAKTLLDIGCGAGAFAMGLKQERMGNGSDIELWGVEMCPEAAKLAMEVMDRVHVGNIASVMSELPSARFDCIVLNDVLEHVAHPEDILRRIQPLLAPGGVVVASIPNVRHFFNVWDLAVHGRWDYTDEGILDRTHLRFFTRSSMQRMFQNNGYTVETVCGINPTGSLKFKLMNLLTFGRWSDMKYLQFALVASPQG